MLNEFPPLIETDLPGLAQVDDVFTNIFIGALQPNDNLITVSEWADKYRKLSSKSSSEPGQWRTDRAPYLREPMDCLSENSPVETVVMMFGSQLGKTETIFNWTCYIIDVAPGPMLMVQPTLDMVKKVVRQRLDPIFDESEKIKEKVGEQKGRDAANSLMIKSFPGGMIMLAGANSAASLRSMPIRYLAMDEIDAYDGDVEGEGDPVELADARTRTFANRKKLLTSTPNEKGNTRIEPAYEETDQCQYHVPCPHCFEKQILKFGNLKWTKGEPWTAAYQCEYCGVLIEENYKRWMLARENGAEWVAKFPERKKSRGFHMNSLYSPFESFSWAHIAALWENAKGKPTKLKTFINTVLAEVWVDKSDLPDWEVLYRRREHYEIGTVPRGGLLLTAGADVQRNRIECEVVAWGRKFESWSVDYRVFEGDTSQDKVWDEFWEWFKMAQYPHEDGGMMGIRKLAIDSGDQTQKVYNEVRKLSDSRVMATKGQTDAYPVAVGNPKTSDIDYKGQKITNGASWWPVGVSMLKRELYSWLNLQPPLEPNQPMPDGFAHFPQYAEEHFKQLTAEHRVIPKKGGKKLQWVKLHERNEALDCRILARAAAYVFGLDKFTPDHWKLLETALAKPVETIHNAPQPPAAPPRARKPNPYAFSK